MTLPPSPYIYTCPACNFITDNAARMVGHLEVMHNKAVAPKKDGRLTDTKELLIDHIDRPLSGEESSESKIYPPSHRVQGDYQ